MTVGPIAILKYQASNNPDIDVIQLTENMYPLDGVSTLGKPGSGATYEWNSTTSPNSVYAFLWVDTSTTVSGGKGASANADYLAGKILTLPNRPFVNAIGSTTVSMPAYMTFG